ncbi:MAG: DUF1565 domain-containing protein [Terriglobales bacterium]
MNWLILAILLLARAVAATDYYVSARGSDSNPGTSRLPFRTIQRAANIVKPGDTVIVGDGTYSNPVASGSGSTLLDITRSGTPGSYIIFRAQHKWRAVLDGLNNTTAEGIAISGSYIRLQDFELTGFSDDAISNYRGGQFIEIVGNHIHHIGRYCTDTAIGRDGIFVAHDNITVEQNLIHDIGRYSAGENGCAPSKPYYQGNDHGIYISGASNVVIRNNIFYNITHGWSIHVYPKPVHNLSIVSNTFAFPNPWYAGQIIISAPVTNSWIANNIFYEPKAAAIYFNPSDRKFPKTHTISITHNISTTAMTQLHSGFFGRLVTNFQAPGIVYASNREQTNPLLASPSTQDFRLASGSPAIGTGLTLPQVVNDYSGVRRANPPSVGAYEYIP